MFYKQLRVDNGSELIFGKLIQWRELYQVKMMHIQPGKPNQNAYIKCFNQSFRYEVLDTHLFHSLN
jgi:putative transposase